MILPVSTESRARVEEFQRKHRIGLVTLLFTDMAGSTQMKQEMGDEPSLSLMESHHSTLRALLSRFREAQEIEKVGDSFFLIFARPSDAVRFSLLLHPALRQLSEQFSRPILDRIGIHLGEVIFAAQQEEGDPPDLYGLQVDTSARLMSLAQPGQTLLSRLVFDTARQVFKGVELDSVGPLAWLNHGLYLLKGVAEPFEVCEVGESGKAPLCPPPDSEKVRRYAPAESGEPVLGWRPAVEQHVPNTKWVLERKLGEGSFGEVWVGRHEVLAERHVLKFCFRADRVRALKREVALLQLLKQREGRHPNIVSIQDVFLEQPPYYIVMDYAPGQDLVGWCAAQGGSGQVPLETRLELIAQIADALHAAHQAGVVHRDVKPSNIIVTGSTDHGPQPADHGPQPADHGPEGRGQRTEDRGHIADHSTLDTRHSTLGLPSSDKASEGRQATEQGARTNAGPLCAKLTDFGVGRIVSQEAAAVALKAGFTATMTGNEAVQCGTLLYMAPEVLAGKAATASADIYALGVVLYQAIVGDFSRAVTLDWQNQVRTPALRSILRRCFAGEPNGRFQSAAELAVRLRNLCRSVAAAGRNTRIIATVSASVIILCVIALAALSWWLFARPPSPALAQLPAQILDQPDPAGTPRTNWLTLDISVPAKASRKSLRVAASLSGQPGAGDHARFVNALTRYDATRDSWELGLAALATGTGTITVSVADESRKSTSSITFAVHVRSLCTRWKEQALQFEATGNWADALVRWNSVRQSCPDDPETSDGSQFAFTMIAAKSALDEAQSKENSADPNDFKDLTNRCGQVLASLPNLREHIGNRISRRKQCHELTTAVSNCLATARCTRFIADARNAEGTSEAPASSWGAVSNLWQRASEVCPENTNVADGLRFAASIILAKNVYRRSSPFINSTNEKGQRDAFNDCSNILQELVSLRRTATSPARRAVLDRWITNIGTIRDNLKLPGGSSPQQRQSPATPQ